MCNFLNLLLEVSVQFVLKLFLLILLLLVVIISLLYIRRVPELLHLRRLQCWQVFSLLLAPLRVFHTSKSPQVSRKLFCILADLINTEVRMGSTCPLISKSSKPFTNPLEIVLRAPTTIGIVVTFMFLRFFSSLARSWYLSLFLLSFIFTLWTAEYYSSHYYNYILINWLTILLLII